jgi:gamma-glutamyl:cysteine ligase YbdK (ATP-grasp superfamily)
MQAQARPRLRAFAGCGVELEYMIVDRATLDVRPLAPALLEAFAGRPTGDVSFGRAGWSNEIVQHVVELKNPAPVGDLGSLADVFGGEIARANAALAVRGARLMPAGMHPWMDPRHETVLWDTGPAAPIFRRYDALFDCRRHGLANVQSMHVNLPFADDDELARLHAAVRAVLPLVPAIAASSPIVDGRRADALDHRLVVYRTNQSRVPSITGDVIPEPIASEADYRARILAPMYADLAAIDPAGLLAHEWLNSRGAIARFDRNAIEIRLADVQECPRADLAVATAIAGAVRALHEERFAPLRALGFGQPMLRALLDATTRDAERAVIADRGYLAAFGVARPCAAGALWTHLFGMLSDARTAWCRDAWSVFADRGPLARRIVQATGAAPGRATLHEVYGELCDCLAEDRLFVP